MPSRSGKVFMHGKVAGRIVQFEDEFHFEYDAAYLADTKNPAISFSLPKRAERFRSKVLFAFFDGLIPEGWLLNMAEENWKLATRDRMGLLLNVCRDCVGAVHIEPEEQSQ